MPPEEKIVYTRPGGLPEIEVLSVQNSRRLWRWFHVTYSICAGLACDGRAEWVYRGKSYSTPARQLMLLEPGETHHNTRMTFPCTFKVLLIAPAFVENFAVETGWGSSPHFQSAVAAEPEIFRAFVRLHATLEDGATLLEKQTRLADCVARLASGYSERGIAPVAAPARSCLRRSRDCLDAHFAENIALEDLAKTAGLSRFHFLRAFEREFGLPPHAYQINLRVQRARGWLKAGMAIKDIEAGFADQSHLTRHFKRILGVTPAQYAAASG